ncbi:alkene reductase [Umezawaea tangerina]|uniref:N-ethylmaleimide reductase n=1 Tax=Umezawaea tangerina TaxID=84725 RepID=A0A2T0SQY0_9PSEU|nr:alkene reductase [Umezawaea tangerina]PRY35822.1 N-ethylmaleimide reductase [Umezawaea tangerina]
MSRLFEETTVGTVKTASRIAMAPMTRSRATRDGHATDIMAEYYGQRSTAALIITEGIQPSRTGQGYTNTPGLHTEEQVESWKPVVKAARSNGAAFFAQVMHAGRISHPDNSGTEPVAPSAVRPEGQLFTYTGMQEYPTPRELTHDEIVGIIEEHVVAARNAVAAGFDGIEIHGANGYLTQQFLSVSANKRTDEWGGSVQGRIKFAVEVVRAVAEAIGPERTALRISPANLIQGIEEGDSRELYLALVTELAELPLAYLHIMEVAGNRELTKELRAAWPHTLVVNPHRDADPLQPHEAAQDALEDIGADLVAFGSSYLANPDLPERLAAQGPYQPADQSTFFGGDHVGYLDYPTLKA